jgi:Zn-dependent protease with chaperone function
MPYSQIIILIITFIAIAGAPISDSPKFSFEFFLWLWFCKTCFWFIVVFATIFYGKLKNKLNFILNILQWLTPLPIILDLYLFEMRTFIEPKNAFMVLPFLINIFYLLLYFFYVSIYWAGIWWATRARSLKTEILSRFIVIAPMIIPYILFSVADDLLRLAPQNIIVFFNENFFGQMLSYLIVITIMVVFVPILIKTLWGCESFPEGRLRDYILNHARGKNLKFKDILIWNTPWGGSCTAGVMGFVPNFRYLLLTPCILENLTTEELDAVLYHEFTHIKKNHIWWQMGIMLSFGILMYSLFEPVLFFFLSKDFGVNLYLKFIEIPGQLLALITVLPFIVFAFLYLRFFMGYFIRNFEREADIGALETQGHPWHLANSLEKVAYLSGISRDTPSWHHYSIAERAFFLRQAYEKPSLAFEFKRQIQNKRSFFVIFALSFILLSNFLPVEIWKKQSEIKLAEHLYEKEDNPGSLLILGQFFYELKRYDKSFEVLKKALNISPTDPEILNTLAWLLLTSESMDYRDPKWALELAEKAASLKDEAHILDTLAEAYYANGKYDDAISWGEKALKKAPEDRAHYIRQLNKFKSAKNKHQNDKNNQKNEQIMVNYHQNFLNKA